MRTFVPRVALAVGALLALAGCGGGPSSHDATPAPSSSPPSPARPADPAWVTGRVTTGDQPCGVLGAAGRVWVSNYFDDTLVSLDPRSLRERSRVHVGSSPCGLAYGAGSIWVEDYGDATVTRVDAATGRRQRTYRVGSAPYDLTFAGGAAWVTDYGDGAVSRIDARSGAVTTIRTGGTPIGIAPAGGKVWIGAGPAGIVGVDVRTARVVRRVPARAAGWTAYEGDDVWVNDGSAVVHLDGTTGRVLDRTHVGPRLGDGTVVDGVAWVPDTRGSLHLVRDGRLLGSYDSGVDNPFVIAVAAGRVWAVDFNGTDVVRIAPSRVR